MNTLCVHGLEDGYDIRTVEELLGHKDVKTTMVHTDLLNRRRSRGPQPSRQVAQSRLQRARWDYADRPVGVKLGANIVNMQEIVTNKVVAALGWHRRLRLSLGAQRPGGQVR